EDAALVVAREVAASHLRHEVVAAGLKYVEPPLADQLVSRPATQADEVLVDVREPSVEVDLAGDELDRLEDVVHPATDGLQGALRAQLVCRVAPDSEHALHPPVLVAQRHVVPVDLAAVTVPDD